MRSSAFRNVAARHAALQLTASLLAALLAAGCGDSPTAPSKERSRDASGASAARTRGAGFSAVARVELDEALPPDSLRGVARFAGEPPARRPLPLNEGAGCAPSPRHLTESLIVTAGGVANVLVHARSGVRPEQVGPPPSAPVVIDQESCLYSPHVVALRAGQLLRITNSDGLTHNVNAKPQRAERFNVTQTPGAPPLEAQFARSELSIPLSCDIHPWMSALVHVLEHDAFALSAPSGEFEIRGLAPGSYRFAAVHEALGEVPFQVELDGRRGARVVLEFSRAGPTTH